MELIRFLLLFMHRWHDTQHIHTMDIATYRLNRHRGRFSENFMGLQIPINRHTNKSYHYLITVSLISLIRRLLLISNPPQTYHYVTARVTSAPNFQQDHNLEATGITNIKLIPFSPPHFAPPPQLPWYPGRN